MSNIPRQTFWRKQIIDKVQAEVRAELDAVALPGPDGERLNHAIHQCLLSQSDRSPESQLKTYIYIMSALVEHSRNGGLSDANLGKLFQLAERILRVQKIPLENSSLSFLYGDLYLVMSQIHRLQGLHVEALWEEQISNFLSQRASSERIQFQSLSVGIHLLRMGFGTLALEELLNIAKQNLDLQGKVRWALETHMALRLSFRLEEAERFAIEHEAVFKEATEEQRGEWEWEKMCRDSQVTGKIDTLMTSALPKRAFAKSPYSIEAFFLSRIVPQKNWMERIKSLPAKQKSTGPKRSRYEIFWLTARALKEGYEQELDYVSRLKAIGDVFSHINELKSVFHELLVRAALVRWLVRRPTQVFAKVSIIEYQSLSLKLSGGKSFDVLNLLPDVPYALETEIVRKAG